MPGDGGLESGYVEVAKLIGFNITHGTAFVAVDQTLMASCDGYCGSEHKLQFPGKFKDIILFQTDCMGIHSEGSREIGHR